VLLFWSNRDTKACGQRVDVRQAVITEATILAALDKPRSLPAIQQRVTPGQKDTEELQIVLMRLRDEKKVTFDIHTGRWSKA
jgi:hypothetical protein